MYKSPYALGDSEPPVRWKQHWEYAAWREEVLGGRFADEEVLQACYAEQWEPSECFQAMLIQKRFRYDNKPRKERKRVALDLEAVNRRMSKALWLECCRLLARGMTGEAREQVLAVQAQAQAAAGIIVARG